MKDRLDPIDVYRGVLAKLIADAGGELVVTMPEVTRPGAILYKIENDPVEMVTRVHMRHQARGH